MAGVRVEELGAIVFVDDGEPIVLNSDAPLLPHILNECTECDWTSLACAVH